MRLLLDHRTRYRFSEPQARVVQLLRMTPTDHGGQTIIDWSIDVDCDTRLRDGKDGYGNLTTMLYVDGPVDSVEISVRGEVLTDDLGGLVTNSIETLPPLFYMRPTPLTWSDPAILAFAKTIVGSVKSPMNKAKLLNVALFERVRSIPDRTPKSRTAAKTLADGWGNVRDCAQLMLSAARAVGIPARFVSGHCLNRPGATDHKSAHCWTELYITDKGWVGFDPSSGYCPGDGYVRVAIGLDAGDATPLSGTRTGGGIEELDVDVHVALGQSQAQ
jgi:transglutaminase-like putative cysteine protease